MFQEFTDVLHSYWMQFLYLLPRLLIAAVVLAATVVGGGRLRSWLAAKFATRADDPLLTDFLTEVGRWLLVGLGAVVALNILGFSRIVGGLLGAAGVSAFIVGFAFKDIAENFLAGIILAFNRPFRIHDSIQIKELFGSVTKLNLRSTEILTFDGRDITIPNSIVLKEPLINFTRTGFIRQEFIVSIQNDKDADAAIALMLEQVRQEPEASKVAGREPFAVIDEFSGTAVQVKVYFWTDTADYRRGVQELRSRVMNRVKESLQANGPNLQLPPHLLGIPEQANAQ
ncbi:mechanosensitive ion channel family protein [Hymenobacter sp. DG25B]|jgi:small-conductance mechanosensitive channel|uniref:mechanosensitive ion channel family protein n=1 Tax=Hymenobacter sp. DG25B TaxID=1385664 RepID=UPI0005C95D3F|nr:mechanosensitive ion channel family protein [Hymenobacter sp. DG25B]